MARIRPSTAKEEAPLSDPFDIPRPLARGASRCHVLALQDGAGTMVAACGTPCGSFCGDANYAPGVHLCQVHDEPLCSACREIIEEYEQTGEWRGVVGDPRGPLAVCLEPGCGELIPARGCWCREHLATGCDGELDSGAECQHPAHHCEDPVHLCEAHGGPPT
jgi:hypothetical protein